MTFLFWGKVIFLPARLSPRNRAKRGAKNSRSAERGCSSVHPPPNRRRNGVEVATLLHHQQAIAAQSRKARCKKAAGAQSAAPAGAFRSATAAGGTWRGDRMFLCSPGRRTGGEWVEETTLTLLLGKQQTRPTANKLSPRRAKLALNVRIGCSCRAHNHHKFSHRILQPHTKRRASHAD